MPAAGTGKGSKQITRQNLGSRFDAAEYLPVNLSQINDDLMSKTVKDQN